MKRIEIAMMMKAEKTRSHFRLSMSEISLSVKTLSGATHTLSISRDATVLAFKEKLQELSNVPIEHQRLIFRGSRKREFCCVKSLCLKNTLKSFNRRSSAEERRHARRVLARKR
jgi:hypothetical protein